MTGAGESGRPALSRVLCCLGPGAADGALSHAAALADAPGGRLALLAVQPAIPGRELQRLARRTGQTPDGILRALEQEVKRTLADAAARTTVTPPPTIAVRVGKPFVEIIRAVIDEGHDIVLKTAEELDGSTRHLFASTDQHLLRECPVPVWLHRACAAEPGPDRPVVAAVDVDPEGANDEATEAGLNRTILDTALAIAGRTGATVHLINAFEVSGEGIIRLYGRDGNAEVARYRDEVEREHWRLLLDLADDARRRRAADGLPAVVTAAELRAGAPRTVIPAFVEEVRGAVLVMGTVARTGIPGFIIGNTAEDVLNSVDVSVVAVKPPGYVSPLATAG